MPRATTPSFVAEFEVQTTSKDRRVLKSRREAARQLYDAVLGEALRRLTRMRHDPGFDLAKKLPRGTTGEAATPLQKAQAHVRQEAFAALRKKHGFREFDLHKHKSLDATCWIRGHLDVHAAQKVATRAFKAAERWSFGQSGRPKFKRYGEVESVEGKSNAAGIRYRVVPGVGGRILWNGDFANLDLPLVVNPGDQVQAYALRLAEDECLKYVRLLSRTIRGVERVFAQLVLEGEPWAKLDANLNPRHVVAIGKSGAMDLGPSQATLVTEKGIVETIEFCPGLERKAARIRRYQRQVDRQRRAANPGNYNPDGTIRKGRKKWKTLKRQRQVELDLANEQRAMAAQRKSQQGALAHAVLAVAGHLIVEKTDKREWAKEYGRNVGHKAPGMFESRVAVLAKAGGGSLEKVCTYSTYLSSRCLCGKRAKKTRDERKHLCGCEYVPKGVFADRDEFSAFLALFASGSRLDVDRAWLAWAEWGADCLLLPASSPSAVGAATAAQRASTTRKPREEGLVPLSPKGNKRGRSGSVDKGSGQRRKGIHLRGRRAPIAVKHQKTCQLIPESGGTDAA